MSDPKYHRLIIPFIRADQFGVDAIEILQVESLFPGLEETLEAMTDAITTWIERTDEGDGHAMFRGIGHGRLV